MAETVSGLEMGVHQVNPSKKSPWEIDCMCRKSQCKHYGMWFARAIWLPSFCWDGPQMWPSSIVILSTTELFLDGIWLGAGRWKSWKGTGLENQMLLMTLNSLQEVQKKGTVPKHTKNQPFYGHERFGTSVYFAVSSRTCSRVLLGRNDPKNIWCPFLVYDSIILWSSGISESFFLAKNPMVLWLWQR